MRIWDFVGHAGDIVTDNTRWQLCNKRDPGICDRDNEDKAHYLAV